MGVKSGTKEEKVSVTRFIKSDIKLTIGILVSNHIKYIKKGMEAIKPLLEAVPSELIVVDTVGPEKSDGSLDVVKDYTDKIYHFDWIDDFSAARNVAMEHARGEWFMYFDDDEYFDDVREFIDFFSSDECEKYNYGIYYTGDYYSPTEYHKGTAGRMIRRTTDTRFVGRVHETFNEAFFPAKQFQAFTHHFGYVYENKEKQAEKVKRNLTLLEKDFNEYGPDVKICAQIVQTYIGTDTEMASKKCSEFLKLFENSKDLEKSPGQWLLLAKIRLMVEWGSLEGLLAVEADLLNSYMLKETAQLVLAYEVASMAIHKGRYDIAEERAEKYFKMYDWLMSHETDRILQSNLDFPEYMMEGKLFNITKIGVACKLVRNQYEEAYKYIKRFDYDYCKDFEEIRKLVEFTLSNLHDSRPITEHFKKIYKDEFFDDKEAYKFLPFAIRKRLNDIIG